MQTQTEIRQEGFQWENVQKAFIWNQLGVDLMRELVQYDTCYKTQLEHHLLMAFHGYASYPSVFYNNMYKYLKAGLAEEKELECYSERVGMLYMNQLQQEQQTRIVHSLVDCNGTVLDQIIF